MGCNLTTFLRRIIKPGSKSETLACIMQCDSDKSAGEIIGQLTYVTACDAQAGEHDGDK